LTISTQGGCTMRHEEKEIWTFQALLITQFDCYVLAQ
jgi:hypothetical protein